jgi:phosphotransferase system HPr-like phosphotransfer protein
VKENGKYVVKSAEQIKADIQVESKNDKKVSGKVVSKIVLEQTTDKAKADGKIML